MSRIVGQQRDCISWKQSWRNELETNTGDSISSRAVTKYDSYNLGGTTFKRPIVKTIGRFLSIWYANPFRVCW